MHEKTIEVALKPIMENIEFIKRGKTYGSIVVIMEMVELARLHSTNPIKTNEVTQIPMYMGRRVVKVRVPEIPSRPNPHKELEALEDIPETLKIGEVNINIFEDPDTSSAESWAT